MIGTKLSAAMPRVIERKLIIQIHNLTVEFGGVRGLNHLTADIGANITGLVGPERCRQDHASQRHERFVRRSAGTVMVDGTDLLRVALNRRAAFGVRRTFQTEQVVENLTVWDNVAAALDNFADRRSGPARSSISEALDYVGMICQAPRVALR